VGTEFPLRLDYGRSPHGYVVVKSEWELSSHSDLTTAGHHMRM